jgi:hypothetical protein
MKALMQAALTMASTYHTPVEYWLSLPLGEFLQWAEVAKGMAEEAARNQPRI